MGEATNQAPQALIALAVGTGLGLSYFALLARNLKLYLNGRPVAGGALQAGRFLLVAVGLFGSVQFGAIPLLCCALGLLFGRQVVLRRAREAE